MIAIKEGIWHGNTMAIKSLLPYPYTFIYSQAYIKIGNTMAKVKRICKQCGKEFEVKASAIKYGRGKFCSRGCAGKWQSKHARGENSPRWKGGLVKRNCQECNQNFMTQPSKIENGEGKFCSRKCQGKWKSKNILGKNHPNWKDKTPIVCAVCGTTFFVTPSSVKRGQKCCSLKCRSEYLKKSVNQVCKWCGKEFKTIPSKINDNRGIFCSLKCKRNWQSEYQANSKEHLEHLWRIRSLSHVCPTKPEKAFQELCDRKNLPFRYVGNGKLKIGEAPSLNPDFIHTNKRKKICVEVLGAWWHNSMLNQKIPYERTYNGRKALLKSYGWKMIGIWDHDILRDDAEVFVLNLLKKERGL